MEQREGNILWEVQDRRQPVLICIKDLNGKVLESREYNWIHEPTYGIDVDIDMVDAREIDRILDKLIAKWKKE